MAPGKSQTGLCPVDTGWDVKEYDEEFFLPIGDIDARDVMICDKAMD